MIDLSYFFKQIEDESYAIVKLSAEFPKYIAGSDIDIFCFSAERITKKILSAGNKYCHEGYEITVVDNDEKIYVDFLLNNKIDFRFDLYKKLPHFEHLHIKPALFESIIENRVSKGINENEMKIYIPQEIDELIIRYIEYHEWYEKRPDKIKHIDYIIEATNFDENIKAQFLNKLHYYTAFRNDGYPNIVYPKKIDFASEHVVDKQINVNSKGYINKMFSGGFVSIFQVSYASIKFRIKRLFS